MMAVRLARRAALSILSRVALSRDCRRGNCGTCTSPACDHDCHPWMSPRRG